MKLKGFLMAHTTMWHGWPHFLITEAERISNEKSPGDHLLGYDFSSFREHEHLLALKPKSAGRQAR
jgi:hypothetical protein